MHSDVVGRGHGWLGRANGCRNEFCCSGEFGPMTRDLPQSSPCSRCGLRPETCAGIGSAVVAGSAQRHALALDCDGGLLKREKKQRHAKQILHSLSAPSDPRPRRGVHTQTQERRRKTEVRAREKQIKRQRQHSHRSRTQQFGERREAREDSMEARYSRNQ